MRYLRQSTSVDLPIGPFVDNLDGITAETALTLTQPDIRLKKNGGAWAQKAAAQTLAHEENGFYELTLDATDSDTLGLLRCAVFEAGACPVWEDFMVLPANVWDSLFGADALQVHAVEISAGLIGGAQIISLGTFGDLNPGATLDIKFLSMKAGVLTTLAGSPAVLVYKDNSVTQSTSAGLTLTVDFDGVVGLNNLRLTSGSDGTFYSAGSNFQPYISAGTIGGTTAVGQLLSPFSLKARASLYPTTADATLDVEPDGSVTATGGLTTTGIADEVALRTIAGVTTVGDKTGYALSSGSIIDIWAAALKRLSAEGNTDVAAAVTAALSTTITAVAVAASSHIKRNQALEKFPFQMTDSTTHAPLPGLTGLTVVRSIDGATSAVGTLTNITEHPDADGTYLVDFGPGDLDGKVIKLKASKAGCDDTHERIITVP